MSWVYKPTKPNFAFWILSLDQSLILYSELCVSFGHMCVCVFHVCLAVLCCAHYIEDTSAEWQLKLAQVQQALQDFRQDSWVLLQVKQKRVAKQLNLVHLLGLVAQFPHYNVDL